MSEVANEEVKSFEQVVDEIIASETAADSSEEVQTVATVSVLDVEAVADAVEMMKNAMSIIQQMNEVVSALGSRLTELDARYNGLQEELRKTQSAVVKFADHVASKLKVEVEKKAVELADESLLERSALKSAASERRFQSYFPNNAPGG